MTKKTFDTVQYFRQIKEKLAEKLSSMTLEEQKEYLRKIRNGEIKLGYATTCPNRVCYPAGIADGESLSHH